ncbi:MAG: helix-turn-helix domain-containing protein, partial [Paraprevotella sp.]|nr:helix-turn-helix domain-containing protein [Paraprevotella sp.]
ELNFRRERRVSWYSERIGVSSKTLLEMVKRASRRTPNEWLDIYTSLEIRLLLRNTTKTIKEIASDLHFSNQSSLGKFFREHVGMSPKEYRKG